MRRRVLEKRVDIEQAREYFVALDVGKRGQIDKFSLRHIYAALGQSKPDSLIDVMISIIDVEKKGSIDYETFRAFFDNPAKFFEKRDAIKAEEIRQRELLARVGNVSAGPVVKKGANEAMDQLDPSKLSLQECLRLVLGKDEIKPADIKKLYRSFQASDIDQSGELDFNEFHDMLGMDKPKPIIRRLFDLVDVDGSGSVEIKEFLIGVSSLTSSDPTEKLKLAFTLYDEDGSGTIEAGELRKLIVASMAGKGIVDQKEVDEKLSDVYKSLEAITGKAKKSATALPPITFADFLKIAKSRPGLLLAENTDTKTKLTGKRAEKMALLQERGSSNNV